jgi:hypothetical protein
LKLVFENSLDSANVEPAAADPDRRQRLPISARRDIRTRPSSDHCLSRFRLPLPFGEPEHSPLGIPGSLVSAFSSNPLILRPMEAVNLFLKPVLARARLVPEFFPARSPRYPGSLHSLESRGRVEAERGDRSSILVLAGRHSQSEMRSIGRFGHYLLGRDSGGTIWFRR